VVFGHGLQNGEDNGFLSFFRPRQTEAIRVVHAVRVLDRQVQVHTRSGAPLIEVSYRSVDPARAYGVLKSLANLYNGPAHPPPRARLFPDVDAAITGL